MDDFNKDSSDSKFPETGFGTRTADDESREQRRPLGAPIVRAPLDNHTRSGRENLVDPGAPINLLGAAELHAALDDPGVPGGRRSRAFPEAPPAGSPSDRPLTVVDGYDLSRDEDEAEVAKTLSPPTITALGDFAAAMAGPVAGAIYLHNLAVFIASTLLVLLVRSQGRRSALTESEISGLSPLVAGAGVFALAYAVDPTSTTANAALAGAIALAAGAVAALFVKLVADRFVHVRIAVLGEAAAAHQLAWELTAAGIRRYTVVGYVTRTSERDNLRDLDHISFKVRRLGLLADLSHIVARNDVDLLVMATDQDRLKIFERATVCAERYRTRLLGLTAFEEAVFRRVPVDQLSVAWFQHIMHPRFRPVPRFVTRATDITVAILFGLVTTPVWAATAAFMRIAFGSPVLVHRRRVGERGRSFSINLFRVARRDVTGAPPDEDAPAVGFGKFLRATRIERLPLLLNILRGDMSLVGPRPERPQRMSEVEQELKFYARRNLVRPGITGWAQLHDDGEDPKTELSHDLFYLKHQSLMLYVFVLLTACSRLVVRPRRAEAG